MGGISATTSPAFNGRTDPLGTYSSFNASVMYSSLETSGAKFGYLSAKEVLKNATGDMRFSFPFYSVYYVLVKQINQPYLNAAVSDDSSGKSRSNEDTFPAASRAAANRSTLMVGILLC